MKDRADYARKGIARGRSVRRHRLRRRHPLRRREPLARAAQDLARSTTGSPSPPSASTTSSRTCGWPASATPTCAATPTTARTSPAAGSPTSSPRPWARSSPGRVQAVRGGDRHRRGRRDGGRRPDLPPDLRRVRGRRARLRRDGRVGGSDHHLAGGALPRRHVLAGGPHHRRGAPRPRPGLAASSATSRPPSSRWRCWSAVARAASSAAWAGRRSTRCSVVRPAARTAEAPRRRTSGRPRRPPRWPAGRTSRPSRPPRARPSRQAPTLDRRPTSLRACPA